MPPLASIPSWSDPTLTPSPALARSASLGTPGAEPWPHPLDRLNYFYGQMLGVRDFQSEQRFFREKHKLHNRCLHGHGFVCGLKVTAIPPEKVAPPRGA